MTAPSVVTELSVYPVKSCAGVAVHAAVVTETGFRFDRCWMLAEQRPPPPAMFVSQRTEPTLALVQVSLPPDLLAGGWDGASVPEGACLRVTAPGMPAPLRVPLVPTAPLPRVRVGVWEWTGEAGDEGDDAAAWFSAYLGRSPERAKSVRLVRWLGRGGLPSGCRGGAARLRPRDALASLAAAFVAGDVARRACDVVKLRGHHTSDEGRALPGRKGRPESPGVKGDEKAKKKSLKRSLVRLGMILETGLGAFSAAAHALSTGLVGAPRRRVDAEFAGESGADACFSDGFPILVANEASLAKLNEAIAKNDAGRGGDAMEAGGGSAEGPRSGAEAGGAEAGGAEAAGATTSAGGDAPPSACAPPSEVSAPPLASAVSVPMNRFRANVVIGGPGASAFAEDAWEVVAFGGNPEGDASRTDLGASTTLRFVKPCARCVMTTVDQRTGARGGPEAEPLRTMRETRSGLKCGFRDAWAEEAFFAWNAVGERVGAVVRVGDAVRPRTRTGKFE
jgi:uncharacterized protein YcbX